MGKLTEKQESDLVGIAEGGHYDQAAEKLEEEYGKDRSLLDDILADWNREMCPGCGFVKETHEFVDSDSEPFENDVCRECANYSEDDDD